MKLTLQNLYYMCLVSQVLTLMISIIISTQLRWIAFNLLFLVIGITALSVRYWRFNKWIKKR